MKSKIWTQANKIPLILLAGLLIANAALISSASAEETPEEIEQTEEQEAAKEEVPAKPQVASDDSYIFKAEGCDFVATFPSEPRNTKRCQGEDNVESKKECYQLVSHTHVYDMKTTTDVSLSCNPSSPSAFREYDEEIMRLALRGMARAKNLSDINITFQDFDDYKVANLSGAGKTGRQGQVYIAQLWVAPYSVLSVEGQLIGDAHPQADKDFSKTLKSISYSEE